MNQLKRRNLYCILENEDSLEILEKINKGESLEWKNTINRKESILFFKKR